MTEPRWEDPPAKRDGVAWSLRLTPCVERPGEWLRFDFDKATRARSTADTIKSGRASIPEGTAREDWETTTRTTPEGGAMYVRYKPKD